MCGGVLIEVRDIITDSIKQIAKNVRIAVLLLPKIQSLASTKIISQTE